MMSNPFLCIVVYTKCNPMIIIIYKKQSDKTFSIGKNLLFHINFFVGPCVFKIAVQFSLFKILWQTLIHFR